MRTLSIVFDDEAKTIALEGDSFGVIELLGIAELLRVHSGLMACDLLATSRPPANQDTAAGTRAAEVNNATDTAN